MLTLTDRFRSILFNLVFYPFTLLFCSLVVAPLCFAKTDGPVRRGIGWYCVGSLWIARVFAGVRYEFRYEENVPKSGAFILAAAHQSNMDPMLIYLLRSDVTALAKRQLFALPFIGNILRKAQIIRIDREAQSAHKGMGDVIKYILKFKRPIIVYPQATRVAPGKYRKLKSGAYYLYQDSKLPVVPVATNSGVFWTRGFWHRSGTVIFQVGKPFPSGLTKEAFMERLEHEVVEKSDALIREAGYSALLPASDQTTGHA